MVVKNVRIKLEGMELYRKIKKSWAKMQAEFESIQKLSVWGKSGRLLMFLKKGLAERGYWEAEDSKRVRCTF